MLSFGGRLNRQRAGGEVHLASRSLFPIAMMRSKSQNFVVDNEKPPKAFISYSWTSPQHRELVRSWADRLLADQVDVIIDVYDLKEGHDKYHFMETMVRDPEVTHVLAICDRLYAQKADERKAGVGTETQIISKEVYDKVGQSKFIPIICEFVEREPTLPTFFKTRVWIDFSTLEKVNENWERLVRLLHGKPEYKKPPLGKAPAYLREDSPRPYSPIRAKLETLREAVLQGKPSVRALRNDFFEACFDYSDSFRIRKSPSIDVEEFALVVLDTCGKLLPLRDFLVDWVLAEASTKDSEEFRESLIELFEGLLEQKTRPRELTSWQDHYFEAHSLFVYETFLYIVAALLKAKAFEALHNVFTAHYLRPRSEDYDSEKRFVMFDAFNAYGRIIGRVLTGLPEGHHFLSPAGELMKRQASRADLPFTDVIQAEVLVQLMAYLKVDGEWFPNTMFYSSYEAVYPFFMRATRRKDFDKLVKITGIATGEEIRAAVKQVWEKYPNHHSRRVWGSFWTAANLDKLGSLT